MLEAEAIAIVCAILGGEAEERHSYSIDGGNHYVSVDCETESHAIEVGLDRRSSLDSVQQAEFFAWITGKQPMVLIVDTDGREDQYEFRIETAARRLGVEYMVYDQDFLLRWQMTEYFRHRRSLVLGSNE